MARRIREYGWAVTSLGPIEGWSSRLRTHVEMILASAQAMAILCAPDRIMLYNDACATTFGPKHPQALGRPSRETFVETASVLTPCFDRAFAGETVEIKAQPLDLEGPGTAGANIFDMYLTPIREDDGHVAYVHTVGFNQEPRLRAEAALRASEAKYKSLFESIDEGFAVIEFLPEADGRSADFRFLEVNEAFERQTGNRDVTGKLGSEINPGADAGWIETFGEVARTGEAKRFESHHEDTGRWYDVFATRVGDAKSRQVCVVFQDITDRSRMERALRESEARYRLLFDAIDAGFCTFEMIFDDQGEPVDFRYIEVNEGFAKQMGRRPNHGATMRETFPEAEHMWLDLYAEVSRTGEAKRFIDFVGGLNCWYDVYVFPIYLNDHRILGALFRDVTDQKRADGAMRQSEERQAFLLKLSDAVRPLASAADIQGETTRLLREQLNAGWCYYVEWDLDKKVGLVLRDSAGEGLPSFEGAHDVSDAPEFLHLLAGGTVLTVRDYAGYEQLPARTRQLAERVMGEKELDPSDTALRNSVVYKTVQALRQAKRRGKVQMLEKQGGMCL